MSEQERPSSNPGDELQQLEVKLLKAEILALHAEIAQLRNSITDLRSSAVFRLREKVLPENSFLQRLYLAIRTRSPLSLSAPSEVEYKDWVKRWDSLTEDDRAAIRAEVGKMKSPPLISIAMPVYNTPARFLEAAICSVREQLYPHWELCIADDASSEPSVRTVLERVAREEPRIKVVYRTDNGRIAAATNDALSVATGAYVGFLDHDDTLSEHALFTIAKSLENSPEAKLLYSDEDKIDESGNRSFPHFKPNWDPLMLLAFNYVSHFTVYRSDLGRSLGWLRNGYEGAQDWDFTLRFSELVSTAEVVHIPHVLYHWRTHSGSTAQNESVKPYVAACQVSAVKSALDRRGELASVARVEFWSLVRVSFIVRPPQPLVSLVIPTRDRADILSKCIASLFALTEYPNYEVVILDNGSVETQTKDLFAGLSARPNVKIIPVDAPFNYSALNNRGVAESSGEIVALLNNDIEITEPQWMERLVAHVLRPGTGAVGPRLLYPNGQVQHAGVLIGFRSVAAHYHLGIPSNSKGYMGRAVCDQYVSGVTGACLFVRREHFEAVGGLDEQLAVAYNDVDLCLQIQALGLRNVYAGSVTCTHHESASRGLDDTPEKMARATFEVLRIRARWGDAFKEDPAYNPNLCLERRTFAIAKEPRVSLPWRKGV
jgi:glycosyltransferase involved in cell wall biosynthesis